MKKLLTIIVLLSAPLLLAGCLDRFFFSPEYTVVLPENSAPLQKDIQAFVDDRFSGVKPMKDLTEDQKQQQYQQDIVETDLVEKMKSEGYYDAAVSFAAGDKEWSGAYTITSGAVYTIGKIAVKPDAYAKYFKKDDLKGQALNAAKILTLQADIYKAVQRKNCYFTLNLENRVTLDAENKTADIVFALDAGAKAHFADVIFSGNNTIKPSYLARFVPWKNGDCFERQQIESLKAALFETGLISSAEVVFPDAPAKDGAVPLTIVIKERAHRTVSAGLTYYSDEGPGVTMAWKHRNILGAGESVEANLKASQLLQSLDGKFTKPYFLRQDQTLSFNTSLNHENTDAYEKTGIEGGVAIKRNLSKRLTFSTGATLAISRIRDETTNEDNNYGLVSFPQTLVYDSRNHLLDPTKGWLLEGGVEPFVDAFGEADPFWKSVFSMRTYYAPTPKTTLALRVKAGSILARETDNLPATERFYAGGGGSVRGFGYQEVGPSDKGEPTGGRALAEVSAEVRQKFNDTIGGVVFVDAGSVSDQVLPNFSDAAVGAGVGLRYYTGFGPVRFDVGVPLTNREDTDSFQVYISIGQAF